MRLCEHLGGYKNVKGIPLPYDSNDMCMLQKSMLLSFNIMFIRREGGGVSWDKMLEVTMTAMLFVCFRNQCCWVCGEQSEGDRGHDEGRDDAEQPSHHLPVRSQAHEEAGDESHPQAAAQEAQGGSCCGRWIRITCMLLAANLADTKFKKLKLYIAEIDKWSKIEISVSLTFSKKIYVNEVQIIIFAIIGH